MQDEESRGQQPDMPADATLEKNLCLDCGVDISHRRFNARRCEPCSTIRNRQRANNYYRENRERVLQRIKSWRQTPKSKQLRQTWRDRNPEKLEVYRQRNKEKHREKTGYNPEGRTCEDCHADISLRGHRAKRCKSCSTSPTRKCMVCSNHIGQRGPSKFCSEQCKIQDRLSKDVEGWTKVCTKCKKAKEHIEFRLHYNRRDSTCKSCEVKSQSQRYRNFTPEQRARRRRLRREREQVKRTNQSSEEKAMETIKRRKVHRRKLYGPDFDEDRLYSEQEGKCAICRTPKSLEELELDHDHVTRRLRGFLCKNCNFKLLSRYERFPIQHQDSPYLNAYLEKGKQQ